MLKLNRNNAAEFYSLGTDAVSMHISVNSVPLLSIGVATRYIHSHAGILHRDDFENTVKLIVEVIKKLDRDK